MKKIILSSILLASTMLFATEVTVPSAEKTLGNVKKGESLYKRCAGCHGVDGKKQALGKSKKINEFTGDETLTALKGYGDGSYGGAMKGVMKGQVTSLKEQDLKDLSAYISTLGN